MWSSMPIFSFIGYTLTELFRKPDNLRQIYKQTSSTLFTSDNVSRRKKYYYVITRLRNSCLIEIFLKKYWSSHRRCRSNHRRFSVRKDVFKNFANFIGKQLCWSLFLWRCRPPACKFFKKRLQHKCFPVKFVKLLRTPILKIFRKRLLPEVFYKKAVFKTSQYSQDECS